MSELRIGHTVLWRGTWGKDVPREAKVERIEIVPDGQSDGGRPVTSVPWNKVNTRNVVVDLDNGHWAYGTQLTEMKQDEKEEFLGMTIRDSGNGDGVTLVINGASHGNFGKDWDMARKWALRWYLILRPTVFGHALTQKLHKQGGGTWGEFTLLEKQVKKEGLKLPEGVEASNCGNYLIQFKGETI